MNANNVIIDKLFSVVTQTISEAIGFIIKILFSNNIVTFIIWFILINFLAIVLMKKDKEYSKIPEAKRVRESTLLTVAAVGGAIGEFYAMYKYKHKTLHKKFTLGLPIMIMVHFAMLAFNIFYAMIV